MAAEEVAASRPKLMEGLGVTGTRGGLIAASPKREQRLTAARKEAFRAALEEKRAEFLDLYRHDLEAGQSPSDEGTEDLVDVANKAYSKELMLQLSDTERGMIFAVDEALARLDAGVFGICQNCGNEIGVPRLNAVPWARYCIHCQEREENGLLD